MKQIKKVVSVLVLLVICFSVRAQNVLDRAYIKEHNPYKKLIPYTYLREADVMWHHRVWRAIDLREKMNFPLYYPTEDGIKDRSSLFKIIKNGVAPPDGSPPKLTAYDQEDDEFGIKLNALQVQNIISQSDTVLVLSDPTDPGSTMVPKLVKNSLDPNKITKYWLKEDWFFDKQKSVLEARIIGIQAIQAKISGGVSADAGTFWIYFPELRPLIAKEEVFNRHNDAERLTFDDLFWKRQFSGYVFRENNVYDNRLISAYKSGNTLEVLLEAEKIKNSIFTLEHDLWHF
jgi:gliding motility associated protien GldN